MQTVQVTSLAELSTAIGQVGPDALFRGQTAHHGAGEETGLKTSFDRQGCVPPLMIKWAHYAEFMLRQLAETPSVLDRLEFVQAVLQHYGWRSLYLDLSASPTVSAFFAGWRWVSRGAVELVEDCFEDPVCAVRTFADYHPFQGEASLYVICRPAIEAAGIGIHDLAQLSIGVGGQTRYQAQQAWLAGPLHGSLPAACVLSRITGPAEVFRAYAATGGYADVPAVFPPRKIDAVLELLLSLPWIEIPGTREPDVVDIGFYRRSLDIPEYHEDILAKHQPPSAAFFNGKRIADLVDPVPVVIRRAPAHIIFGSYGGDPVFPNVTALVRRHKRIIFETDELIWLPESVRSTVWGKGLWVEEAIDGKMRIADMVVDHPGQQLTSFGALAMWTYAVDDEGRWTRAVQADDCPCGHDWRHDAHLSALGVLEDELVRRDRLVTRRSGKGEGEGADR